MREDKLEARKQFAEEVEARYNDKKKQPRIYGKPKKEPRAPNPSPPKKPFFKKGSIEHQAIIAARGKLSDEICGREGCIRRVPMVAILYNDPYCSRDCSVMEVQNGRHRTRDAEDS